MAEERLNNLEEKLKQLLADFEGDTGSEDWDALSEKLDKQDAKGSDASFGALLSGITGETDATDWDIIVDKLDKHDAKVARKKRAAYVSVAAAIIAGLITMYTINPFAEKPNSSADTNTTEQLNAPNNSINIPQTDNNSENSNDQNSPTTDNYHTDDFDNTSNPNGNSVSSDVINDNTTANNASNDNIDVRGNNNIDNNTRSNNDSNNTDESSQDDATDKTEDVLVNNDDDSDDEIAAEDATDKLAEDKEKITKQDDATKLMAQGNNAEEADRQESGDNQSANKPINTKATKQKNELTYNPLRNKITLGFFISPEYVISSFQTQPNSEESWRVNKNYEDINNNQRSNALGFTTGFSFNYNPFSNLNLSIKTGVRYTENSENVDFDYEINEVIIEDAIAKKLYYYRLPVGDETKIQRATTNKISYIEIPFSFGYNFNLGEKGKTRWSIAPSIGGSYTKMLNASGVKLNETTLELEQVNYNELNKTNWTLNASIGVYYQLNDKFSVGVLPTYRTYLQTIENGNNYLKNKPYTIGISTGIRYSVF